MDKIKGRSQIEIRKAGDNEYYFVFRLPIGGIFISNFFEDIMEAVATAESFRRNSEKDSNYLRKINPPDQYHFILKAKDNSSLGQSSMYKCEPLVEAGIQYMKEYLLEADILDLTK